MPHCGYVPSQLTCMWSYELFFFPLKFNTFCSLCVCVYVLLVQTGVHLYQTLSGVTEFRIPL